MNQTQYIELIHNGLFDAPAEDMSYYNCTTPDMNCTPKTPEQHDNLRNVSLKDQGYRNLTCADKKYAQQMLTRANNETFYQNLISAQLKVLKTELVDYLQLIINLTNTIGYKTEGE